MDAETNTTPSRPHLGWLGIVRLGLVQTALGGIVVLTTSTINRVMVVELALPAVLPGLLVGLHYAVQVLRPRWGYQSDVGRRRTPWIIGGMAMLALGGFGAAAATALMSVNFTLGLILAVLAFLLIGFGVGAAGTSLLVLLAKRVAPDRRPAAATVVWVMMIMGFIVTAGTAGHFLDPFSLPRLLAVAGSVSLIAFLVATLAVWGVEGHDAPQAAAADATPQVPFMEALREVWAEREARQFTIFIFMSMLAYSAQDLILEPYAGAIFAYTPGASTKLAGVQHGGVLAGMIAVAVIGSLLPPRYRISLRTWTVGGCIASAITLSLIAMAGFAPTVWPLKPLVFMLGVSNGAFAVAAIGSMMALAGKGRQGREGVRMGLWGAAQALAFGAGGLIGAVAVDIMRLILGSKILAYATVFAAEGALFLLAALLAFRMEAGRQLTGTTLRPRMTDIGKDLLPQPAGPNTRSAKA
ncbi:MAG: photosynthetic complex assembly protein [Pseudomonadota bacterium]